MEAKEVRELSDDELRVKLTDLRESLFMLRLRQGTNQLESPAKVKQTRRDIARVLTVQHSRSSEGKK